MECLISTGISFPVTRRTPCGDVRYGLDPDVGRGSPKRDTLASLVKFVLIWPIRPENLSRHQQYRSTSTASNARLKPSGQRPNPSLSPRSELSIARILKSISTRQQSSYPLLGFGACPVKESR